MHTGPLVFAQVMDFLPRHEFSACVRYYGGERRPRGFSCRDQFLAMAFAQLIYRESLRCDQTIVLAGPLVAQKYSAPLRRTRFVDPERGRRLTFLTNCFALPVATIAELYRRRWRIEPNAPHMTVRTSRRITSAATTCGAAPKAGIPEFYHPVLERRERSERNVSILNLRLIARVLRVELADLV